MSVNPYKSPKELGTGRNRRLTRMVWPIIVLLVFIVLAGTIGYYAYGLTRLRKGTPVPYDPPVVKNLRAGKTP